MSPSSGHVAIVTIGDLFSNKFATDAWVYHFCSTAIAVLFLSLTESARARAIFVPVFERLASAFTCCASAESLVPPPAAAAISDSDVRTSIYYATVRCISVSALTHACFIQVINEETRLLSEPGPSHQNALNTATLLQPVQSSDIVQLLALKKTYPSTRKAPAVAALHSLSLGISKGEVFGLLGCNGAGKTTTVDMITNVLLPTSGRALVGGIDVHARAVAAYRIMGYCPQFSALWEDVTVLEHLRVFGRVGGLLQPGLDLTCRDMMAAMSLSRYETVLAGDLSGGNKRKLSFAIAMLASPQVVLLDEPSSGMDPASRKFMHQIISSVKAEDRAVVLTSHSMEEADALCSRIGIMARGQLRCLGTSVHLKQKHGRGFIVTMQTGLEAVDRAIAFVGAAFPGAELTHNNAGHLSFNALQGGMKLSSAYAAIEAKVADIGVLRYSVLQPTLEQVFLSISAQAAGAPGGSSSASAV